jgi:hypothetical protein
VIGAFAITSDVVSLKLMKMAMQYRMMLLVHLRV